MCIVDRSRSRQVRKPLSKEQKEAEARVALKSISELTKSPKSDGGKKPDLRARYWKFLFDNLQRAVDAIYETCEQDESALECRVCIMGTEGFSFNLTILGLWGQSLTMVEVKGVLCSSMVGV